MQIFCKSCKLPLTTELVLWENVSSLYPIDGKSLVPAGRYVISDGEMFLGTKGVVLINQEDMINTKEHSDGSRLNGCCGLDGQDGPNKMCKNGHEVATEISDCWLPWIVAMEMDKVFLK